MEPWCAITCTINVLHIFYSYITASFCSWYVPPTSSPQKSFEGYGLRELYMSCAVRGCSSVPSKQSIHTHVTPTSASIAPHVGSKPTFVPTWQPRRLLSVPPSAQSPRRSPRGSHVSFYRSPRRKSTSVPTWLSRQLLSIPTSAPIGHRARPYPATGITLNIYNRLKQTLSCVRLVVSSRTTCSCSS